ncbi:MAG: SDR family oxidoreductase [Pseudomonadota bacterium]
MPGARLEGKTAVITGGTTGIGLQSAKRFQDEGAQVFVTGSNLDRLSTAINKLGDGASGAVADVRDIVAIEGSAAEARAKFENIDILFANAGLGVFAPLDQVDEAAYDKQFDINVKGVFFTLKAFLPLMREGGSIVLTASAVHEKGIGKGSLYFATKAAVRSFARTLAAELGPQGIRVNSLSPGVVRTEFSKKVNLTEDAFDGFMQMVVAQAPLGREGTVEDMANAALFLASDEAAYITGSDIVVDGGWMNV